MLRLALEADRESAQAAQLKPQPHRSRPSTSLRPAIQQQPLKRFNERGLPGLDEDIRSGRPPTYTAEERSAVIKAALSRPLELGLPFASWTLDRLVAYLGEQGIGMRRSRVSEVLLAEGLKWRQEGSTYTSNGFGARVDPAFAEKRGPSSNSTPRRRSAA
jgi:transposase